MSIAGTCAFIASFSIALEKMNLLTEGLAEQPPLTPRQLHYHCVSASSCELLSRPKYTFCFMSISYLLI